MSETGSDTKCLGVSCGHAFYRRISGMNILWCERVDTPVIKILVCPGSLWTKDGVGFPESDPGDLAPVVKGGLIYKPEGKAREYAALALNLYNGCSHGCRYCYAAQANKKAYHGSANPRDSIIQRLRRECGNLKGNLPEILLSFQGDVYQPEEMELGITRNAIKILMSRNLAFTILTKGGTRACRDFDFLEKNKRARFGTTLVFWDQEFADKWEPNAASIGDRVEAIEQAKQRGIPTWISLEPVIDPDQALQLIMELHPIVDHWKIGKLNHDEETESKVDWILFREQVKDLLDSIGADYYLKKSLTSLKEIVP